MKAASTRTLLLAAIAFAVVHAEVGFCPNHCKCTDEGSGVNVACTKLDAKDQRFIDHVAHLVITNDVNAPISLTDNIFSKLGLTHLESIKIINSSLTNVSQRAFHGLPSLFEVNLSDNQLFLIHADTFINNSNLHRLKLSGNPLQLTQMLPSPHGSLLRSSSLSDLDLSNCQLSQILPKTFSQLTNLYFLTLSFNYLKTVPQEAIESLNLLEELDLSHNQISVIKPNAFKKNEEISYLKLQGNPIEALSGINAPNMESLDLSDCKLRILMKETIDGMPDLVSLNLSHNQIDVISDDSFNNVVALKYLDLSRNKLIGPLPRDLFVKNRDLVRLSLSGNRDLGTFVEEPGFKELHLAMSALELANCGLSSLTGKQLTGMEGLTFINVSGNGIRELNETTFSALKHLKTLDLSYNLLVSLGAQLFAHNPELERLRLNGNPLKVLPLFAFAHTPGLRYLDARNCQLEHVWDVPKNVGEASKLLKQLSYIDLGKNRLRVPHVSDFDTMTSLSAVNLDDNPMECIKTTMALIEWLMDQRLAYYDSEGSPKVQAAKSHWNALIDASCPAKVDVHPTTSATTAAHEVTSETTSSATVPSQKPTTARKDWKSVVRDLIPPSVPGNHNTPPVLSLDEEVVVETDSSIMWPLVLAFSVLIVALYFIVYLVGEITHRRRTVAATYGRPASLGGTVRTRGVAGSPLYYKLYEECSVPVEPVKTKKYVLDFSPIHTILKKNSYKVMKSSSNNEANV